MTNIQLRDVIRFYSRAVVLWWKLDRACDFSPVTDYMETTAKNYYEIREPSLQFSHEIWSRVSDTAEESPSRLGTLVKLPLLSDDWRGFARHDVDILVDLLRE